MLQPSGQIAAHWQEFGDYATKLGIDGLNRVQSDIHRRLREHGVTYNIHNGHAGRQWDWALDLVPLIIAEADWTRIEEGVRQRARLLNLILADLYGPQTLLHEQLLPFDLIYQDPSFLRPCHGISIAGNHHLVRYAVDLARGPDGQMWVVGDRTQAPSGSGYALENRTIVGEVQQEFFRENAIQNGQVRRLSGYFRELQSTLARLAPRQIDSPHTVVLTPGPHSETYFEHAYLASYLGYPLVQGADLSVYDGRVNLKTLDGLQPVDTILRRVDDNYCDPLELRADSQLGVTGMVEAVRRGQVTVVNPLGAGVLENLGIMPFLQNIAEQRLGEELILPMAATWWCGQPKELDFVLANIDELIVRPTSPRIRQQPIIGSKLGEGERAALIEKIRAHPHRYVGQQQVNYSTTPAFIGGQLVPRYAVLRSFALAREDDYTVMPGGLTRSAVDADALTVSNSQGGVSKDTWVLTSQPQQHVSLWRLHSDQIIEAIQSAESLPSRSTENLFWVGCYAERAESTARSLRTILGFFNRPDERTDQRETAALNQLLFGLTQVTMTYPGFVGEEGAAALQNPLPELLAVALDPQKGGGMRADLQAMVNAAHSVRNLWSNDTWRVIREIQAPWDALKARADGAKTLDEMATLCANLGRALDHLIMELMALTGLQSDSMTQNAGWAMLEMGRRLERAVRTTALIRSTLVVKQEPMVEHFLLENILKTTDNTLTYRRRYRSFLQLQTVLDLLLLDDLNPRSLLWQFNRLNNHIQALPRTKHPYQLSREEQILTLATTQLQLCNTESLVQTEADSSIRAALDSLMGELTFHLSDISEVVTQQYFTHIQDQRQFGTAIVEVAV